MSYDVVYSRFFTLVNKTGLVFLLFLFPSAAAPLDHWFEKANQFYTQQQYDSAAYYYEKIVETGTVNSAVLYNLGNAWYRLQKIGLARLCYERALRLSPNDPDIAANIKFINANIVDRVPEPEKGFLESILSRLHTWLSLQSQLWLCFIVLCLLSLLIASCFYVSGNGRLWLIYLSVLLGGFQAALGMSMAYKIHDLESVKYAIVLAKLVDARNEPDGPKILFSAHEGTKFRIRKTLEGWVLVSLPNGVSGWIETKSIGNI